MQIPSKSVKNLITILEWNIKTFHSPELPEDDFVKRWNQILDLLYQNIKNIDDKYLYFISYAVQSAKNYPGECEVSPCEVDELFDWIMPLYLKIKV